MTTAIIVTLFLTLKGETHAPASWESDDFTALHECDRVAAGMPAELGARCVAEFAE